MCSSMPHICVAQTRISGNVIIDQVHPSDCFLNVTNSPTLRLTMAPMTLTVYNKQRLSLKETPGSFQ